MVKYSFNKAGEEMGYGLLGDENICFTLGMNRAGRKAYFKEKYGQDFPYDAFQERYSEIYKEYVKRNGLPVKTGLYEILEVLEKKGIPAASCHIFKQRECPGKFKEGRNPGKISGSDYRRYGKERRSQIRKFIKKPVSVLIRNQKAGGCAKGNYGCQGSRNVCGFYSGYSGRSGKIPCFAGQKRGISSYNSQMAFKMKILL